MLLADSRLIWKQSNIKKRVKQGEHETGLEMVTYTAEPVRFLPWMMNRCTVVWFHPNPRFLEAGGGLVRRRVENLKELENQYEVPNTFLNDPNILQMKRWL